MIQFILLTIVFAFNMSAHAAVQTDTHTYIVGAESNMILAINRRTGKEQLIFVGDGSHQMIVHGNLGYIANISSNTVSVINTNTNKLVKTISVGKYVQQIVKYENVAYVVNEDSHNISVLDLNTKSVTQTIPVGQHPMRMVIHENIGYVVNVFSNNVSVLDLKTNTVIQTIPVGDMPQGIVIYGNLAYVINTGSANVSVIDLHTNNIINHIRVGKSPIRMVIDGNFGYVNSNKSNDISVIDLHANKVTQTIPVGNEPSELVSDKSVGYIFNRGSMDISILDLQSKTIIGTLKNPNAGEIDFSDTHTYFGIEKIGPLYPTLDSLQRMKEEKRLDEFVKMNPKAFDVGEVKPRAYPKQETDLDLLPPYALAQEVFWDLKSGKPIIDPLDILANLTTMMYPQKFLQTEAGRWLRPRLHMAFFQAVWLGQNENAQKMLRYFIQLDDPVITKLTKSVLTNVPGYEDAEDTSTSTNSTSK